jgi:capsular exopolysaccharide synthesis family protein
MSRVDDALSRVRRDWESAGLGETGRTPAAAPGAAAELAPVAFPMEAPARPTPGRSALHLTNDPPHASGAGVSVARAGALEPREPSLVARTAASQNEKTVIGTMTATSVEQYRRLAAALHQMQSDSGLKTLLIGSAAPGEGKTLTACNLALTLSESYRRHVLLIDGDLRMPSVHGVFGISNASGLSEELRGDRPVAMQAQQLSPTLAVMPAGHPDSDPMGGLTSDRMQRLIRDGAARFDWVIIDTPPIGLLPDAGLLAAMVDAVLLVVRAGVTPYPMVQRALEAIGRSRVAGMVLNGVDAAQLNGGYGYGKYYSSSVERV